MNCRFAYAQARLQARYAGLPTAEEWQRLTPSRSLAAFLEDARTGPLRAWVKAFSGQSSDEDVEIGVRAVFFETVEEVARWVPAPWGMAVRWIRWLPLLPLWDHLARGGREPDWLVRDSLLRLLLGEDGRLDPRRVTTAGAGPLLAAKDPGIAWAEHWRSLWPRCQRELIANLEAIDDLLRRHLLAFRCGPPESAWGQRTALRARLRLLFHQRLLQPASPLIYLALVALDLERLRAELLARALFTPGEAA